MPTLIEILSAIVACAVVLPLLWRKAGVPRTLLACAIGCSAGVGVAMANQMIMGQEMTFVPRVLLAPIFGAYFASAIANRRAHQRQQKAQKEWEQRQRDERELRRQQQLERQQS